MLLKELETLRQEVAENEALEAVGKMRRDTTDAYPVDGVTLCNLLVPDEPPQEPPRLVFLHAGYGAAGESIASLRSVAQELIGTQIPCVIAMQHEISYGDATLFATIFYERIGRGRPIDEAVTAARYALGTVPRFPRNSWDNPSFGAPVLYLQSRQAVLFPQPEPLQPLPPPLRVPCPYPDCRGWVRLDGKFCITCKRKLMQCPLCHSIMAAQSRYKMYEECGWSEGISPMEPGKGMR